MWHSTQTPTAAGQGYKFYNSRGDVQCGHQPMPPWRVARRCCSNVMETRRETCSSKDAGVTRPKEQDEYVLEQASHGSITSCVFAIRVGTFCALTFSRGGTPPTDTPILPEGAHEEPRSKAEERKYSSSEPLGRCRRRTASCWGETRAIEPTKSGQDELCADAQQQSMSISRPPRLDKFYPPPTRLSSGSSCRSARWCAVASVSDEASDSVVAIRRS